MGNRWEFKKNLKSLWEEIPLYGKLIVFSLITLLILLLGCESLKKTLAKPDNAIEELAEDVVNGLIKEYTGIEVDLDFTPSSPEKGEK
jgi:hypothetical protein